MPDRLDELFAELRAEPRWPASVDVTLEDRMMDEMTRVTRARRRRGRVAAPIGAMALLVGVAGAAGGWEAVRAWFGKVELVSPDGTTATFNLQGHEVFDEHGQAVGELTMDGGEGEQAPDGHR